MTRIEALAALSLFVGTGLLLSRVRWFARVPLVDRLRPYTPGGLGVATERGVWSVESFGEVIAPLSRSVGTALARVFGVSEELEIKLRRLHLAIDVGEFRTRQVGLSLVAALASGGGGSLLGLPPPTLVLVTVTGPLLTFLVIEHKVVAASEARQERLRRELPVVAEQLAMALSAGYSMGAALQRVADRGSGVAAEDLRRVAGRVRQGLTEIEALREWAELANVDTLDRLVAVLELNREAGDLGLLIADEARSARRDAHRRLLATIERRDQQVWIPVAIAALVPGTILVAIPFVQAMRTFSAG
jgi:tight adherence protein C